MEHSELTVVISGDNAKVSLRYNGQEYTENWSRVGRGDNFHMDSNRDQVEIPDKLAQSVDPKFLTDMMEILNKY